MGMGKTACAVGAIQLNPPPEDWRKNRKYQTLRQGDHLCERAGGWQQAGACMLSTLQPGGMKLFSHFRVPAPLSLHAASIRNNMPHGGTLIVMPATLVDQW